MNWTLFIFFNAIFIPTLGSAILQCRSWADAAPTIGFLCVLIFLDARTLDLWLQIRKQNKSEGGSDDHQQGQ